MYNIYLVFIYSHFNLQEPVPFSAMEEVTLPFRPRLQRPQVLCLWYFLQMPAT